MCVLFPAEWLSVILYYTVVFLFLPFARYLRGQHVGETRHVFVCHRITLHASTCSKTGLTLLSDSSPQTELVSIRPNPRILRAWSLCREEDSSYPRLAPGSGKPVHISVALAKKSGAVLSTDEKCKGSLKTWLSSRL